MFRSPLFGLALVVLMACTPRAAETPAPAAEAPLPAPAEIIVTDQSAPSQLLPGAWVSVDDAKSVVTITPEADYIETYDGGDETTSKISWVSTCKDAPVTDAGPYLLVTGDDIERCFKLLSVDTNRLELSYVGRGNTLAYTRIHD